MARYLLDTDVLLRAHDKAAASHEVANQAIKSVLGDGHELYVTPQNLVEFWSVATRLREQNGLGWTPEQTARVVDDLLRRFGLLEDTPRIFEEWRQLVAQHSVRGKQVHDTRLVAAMLAHGVERLLTFNAADFKRFGTISAIAPADLL